MKGSLCEQTVKKGGTTRFRPRPFVRTGAFFVIPGAKVQAFHACMEKPELYAPPRHEEKAIFKENQPSPNVCRIARAAKQRSNS